MTKNEKKSKLKREVLFVSKKAKLKRKASYKKFLEGVLKHRELFVDRKFRLVQKMLENSELKESLESKDRKELSVLERSALDTMKDRSFNSVEAFGEMVESLKEAQVKRAKFKYTAKRI